METVIRVEQNELNGALLHKLKGFMTGIKHPVITIKISDNDEKDKANKEYFDSLDKSIEEGKRGEVVSFTMDEFTQYIKSL